MTTAERLAAEELDRFFFRRRLQTRLQAAASSLSRPAADLLLEGAADPRRRIPCDGVHLPYLPASELVRHGCIADEGRLTGHGIAVAERIEALRAAKRALEEWEEPS